MKQKLSVAPTLKKLRQEKISQRTFLRESSSWRFRFLYRWAMRRYPATGGIWLVWLGIPNHIVCSVFHITAVYIRCGCCPAALVGAAVLGMGIEAGSKEAMTVVPVFTFFVALWLLAFYFMNAGKLVNYISAPVMGGFITGICTTIILMQAPKLMGSAAGTGELFELSEHIWEALYTT